MPASALLVVGEAIGRDGDLEHAVAAVAEQLVGLDDVVEGEAVGDERQRVEAAGLDGRDEPPHPLLAARAERGDDAVVAEAGRERVVRHLELARVHAEARQRAAGPQAAQRVLERLLRAERLDRHVGAAAGQSLDLGDDVDLR